MASEDPKAEGLASRPSRTPPTLDLKAEDITPPAAGEPPAQAPAPADADGAAPADAPAVDASTDDTSTADAPPAPAAPESPAPQQSAEQAAEAELAAAAVPPAPPPARSGAGLVIAALLAGVIGGGAAAGGLWYGLPLWLPPAPAVAPAPPPPPVDLSPLERRIAALEARPVADPQAVSALAARLDRSEAALKGLEGAVAALKAAPVPAAPVPVAPAPVVPVAPVPVAPVPPAPVAAVPAALARSVEELKTGAEATREALASAKREIEALRTAQAGLQGALAAATAGAQQVQTQLQAQVNAQIQALGPRIDAVGPRLDALKKQIEEAAAAATAFNRAAAGLVVLGSFRDAVASGRPFPAELAAARVALGPAAGALDPFASAAAQGYAPPVALASRLAAAGAKAVGALAPPPAPEGETLVNRLLASAESLVKVRPATGPGAVDVPALIDRAVAQVKAGQLEEALATLKPLPQPVAAQLAIVTAEIEARVAALRTASALYQQSLAAISGKVP
ncbi:COG4223 family protein [Xanthobacter sp. AM11]|uniref:COG4223 family protein n=1 Tax=Xanthobacter sp. AM11 TaxID=3380643 RepID=UPI0039BF9CF9